MAKERLKDEEIARTEVKKREKLKELMKSQITGELETQSNFSPMSKDLRSLATLSYSGKVNPFIDKSDIVNHKKKINGIEGRKDLI